MKDKITCLKCGDYYLPDLTLSYAKAYMIGKYRSLRRQFLKEHHNPYYTYLLMTGEITEHLAKIDKTCQNCMKIMVSKMVRWKCEKTREKRLEQKR